MHEALIDSLHRATGVLAVLLGWAGTLVIAYGAGRMALRGLLALRRRVAERRGQSPLAALRIDLGRHLALGLELLVGKDILQTIVDPSWDELGKLAAIVVLRTVLQIFLAREVRELEQDDRHEPTTG